MQVHSPAPRIPPGQLTLEALAHNKTLTESEKIAGVSRHFEAILLRQFLSEAQKPVLDPKGSMHGASNEIYKDMINNVLADEISKSGALGLARYFQTQLAPPKKSSGEHGGGPISDK